MTPGLARASAVIAAAALALVCAGASSARQPPQDVARFTLANGARVLVRPEPASGLVAACVFVRAPNVSEEGQAATGQVLARSLFGANDNLTREAVSRSILALGGGIEVTWQPDYVLVSCVTTPDAFPDAFWLLAQAIKHPVFDEVTVDAARAGASAAARAGETDRLERALAAARRALYAGGPYAQRYDGSDATLRRVTRDAVARHYLQRFAPANTVVSIAGAIDAASARRIVDDQLIDFETPRSRRRRHTPPPPRYAAPSRVAERAPGATVLVLAAYPAPAAGEADYPAAMVLTALLGQGKSSRLFRALRGDSGVGYMVGAEMPALAGPGHLAAFVEYGAERNGGTGADPEATLLQTVRSVLERPPTDAELARARRYAAGAYVLAHQRVRDRAWFAGLFETIAGGWETDRDMASRLGAVTAADVARVATRCLREPVVVVLGPHRGIPLTVTRVDLPGGEIARPRTVDGVRAGVPRVAVAGRPSEQPHPPGVAPVWHAHYARVVEIAVAPQQRESGRLPPTGPRSSRGPPCHGALRAAAGPLSLRNDIERHEELASRRDAVL